jgi:opacity protein-like surface antigen
LLLLALAAAFSASARAEDAPAPVTATASVTATAPVTATAKMDESGAEYLLTLSTLSLFNGGALSYSPFELGWRFDNGVHIRSGLDIFYYEGLDIDGKKPENGVQNYSYDMIDWRTSLLFVVPLPYSLRPVAGVTVELLRGDRKLSGPKVVNAPKIEAWSFLAAGAVLGAQWRAGESWAVELLGRYTPSFSSAGSVASANLGWVYLF